MDGTKEGGNVLALPGVILISGTWWPTYLTADEAKRMGYIYKEQDS